MTKLTLTLATVIFTSLFTVSAYAKDVTVNAEGLRFVPIVVHVAPGDTVSWQNMSIHDVHMMIVPNGAKAFRTDIGQNFNHKFNKQGIYIYQCDPHIGLGMGGVVIVGKPVNLAAVKAKHVEGGLGLIVHKAIKAAEKG